MAEYDHGATIKAEESAAVESQDRGLFDFLGKKDEEKKPQEEAISHEFEEKVHVVEPVHKEEEEEEEKKHEGFLEKLTRSDSSGSSSSDEEDVEEGGEKKKKKKKKGLKEKIKEKISGEHKEEKEEEKVEKREEKHHEDTTVPVEICHESAPAPADHEPAEEKKGFLEKIKEKLPGGHKNAEVAPPSPPAAQSATPEGEAKEKKGILEKIKEKLPGYHPKTEEEKEKEKEKEQGGH